MYYTILTNKEKFTTLLDTPGIELVETWEYYFYGKLMAKYSIVKVHNPKCKITLIDNSEERYTNHIPVKFFDYFEDIEEARNEIRSLARTDDEGQKVVLAS